MVVDGIVGGGGLNGGWGCRSGHRGVNAYTIAISALRLRAARKYAGRSGNTKQQWGQKRGRKEHGQEPYHRRQRAALFWRVGRYAFWGVG